MGSNFWNLRVNDRLSQWKDFRGEISRLPIEKAIEELTTLWSTAPFVTYYLEPSDPKKWPDPWTLLAENYYCDVAKSLGMLYTIYFSSHKHIPMEIRIYYDYNDKTRYSVLWLDDGKYIINYWPYETVNTKQIEEKQLTLLYQYSITDLALEKF